MVPILGTFAHLIPEIKFILLNFYESFFVVVAGDPQEECVRCGKMFLSSTNPSAQGLCEACHAADHGLPLVKPSPTFNDSESEASASNEHEDEDDLG